MQDGLTKYHEYCDGILSQLTLANRTKLAWAIAQNLRAGNRKRITAQIEPDGTPFAPRKKQLRNKKGKIRRKMFTKIRTIKYLKIKADPNSATVSFINSVSSIAKVHQYGLRDKVNRDRPLKVVYKKRELLGINHADLMMIEQTILEHLTNLE